MQLKRNGSEKRVKMNSKLTCLSGPNILNHQYERRSWLEENFCVMNRREDTIPCFPLALMERCPWIT